MKYKYKGFAVCDMCEKKRKLFIVGKNTPIELDLCDECIKRVISPIVDRYHMSQLYCDDCKIIKDKDRDRE